MSSFFFAVNAVLPVFLLILTGIVLRKVSLIDERFIGVSSKLVFKVALPALIFSKISTVDFMKLLNGEEILIIFLVVTGGFLLIYFLSGFFLRDGAERGAFVQGAFRSNIAIVGLAIIINVFGDSGAARTAIDLVLIFPLYNIYAVMALVIPLQKENAGTVRMIVKAIVTNPLIIAVLVALPFSLFSIDTGRIVGTFTGYLSNLTLPLALIGVGGSLNFSSFREKLPKAAASAFIKLVLYPVLVLVILIAAGFRGEPLGVIFIMLGSPSAVSSYVMAKAMGSDSDLAAGIILITTLGSVVTLGLGIFLLKLSGLI
ncbi:MAG: AEC family transporter [Spirochaetales bacterium]|nr:AEC family transporter [Spirochaetales bacterium]